jgi:pyruvate dehydrogenase E1 component alpha subunit
MQIEHTVESLQAFEREIADLFNSGAIRAPIHLAGGNEAQLLELFKRIEPEDWVAGAWRLHLHCLLKGVPPHVLKKAIVEEKRSMTLCFYKQRIIASAIVGGIIPIATGIAMGIKLRGGTEHVWLFCGDMTSRTGTYRENLAYAQGHDLPISFVVEDNGLSVQTDTASVWGHGRSDVPIHHYEYELKWPHSGTGKRIDFKW